MANYNKALPKSAPKKPVTNSDRILELKDLIKKMEALINNAHDVSAITPALTALNRFNEELRSLEPKVEKATQPAREVIRTKADKKAQRIAKQGMVDFRFKEEDVDSQYPSVKVPTGVKKGASAQTKIYVKKPINEGSAHPSKMDVRNLLNQ